MWHAPPAMGKRATGNRIRELRERKGWVQEDLAHRTGLSVWTVHRIETGKSAGTRATRQAIAEALARDVETVFPELEEASSR
jgi:transcriptional regulator with XRE-family HTH domain